MNKYYTHLIIACLIAASLIAYGRIAVNGFVNFDDPAYVMENASVKAGLTADTLKWAFTAVVASNWHPFTLISHILDWRLFGDHAGGHHLMSLLLHMACAVILFVWLNRMTGAIWSSAFCAAFFALHPLRVESVAWVAERKDVLSLFFGLASLAVYSEYVKKPKPARYAICLALFIAALMSKPMMVTLPFVMLLLDYWPLHRLQRTPAEKKPTPPLSEYGKKKSRQPQSPLAVKPDLGPQKKSFHLPILYPLLNEKIPFFILAALSSLITIWAQQDSLASLKGIPLGDRLANAVTAYAAYLFKIFWPADLAVFYPYHPIALWQIFGASILIIGITIGVLYAAQKAPFLCVGWFWYLGTLIPVIGIVQVGAQSMADRYTYLPAIGIGIMLAWGVPRLLPQKDLFKKGAAAAAVAVLIVLSILTWRQCGYWKNSIELFRHTLQSTRNNALAHYNLAVALAAEGKDDEALRHYQEAIKIKPKHGNAHYNLGLVLQKQGKFDEALPHFRDAVKINPRHADAHNNLAILLDKQYHKLDEAMDHYGEALKIDPGNPQIHYNMGVVLGKKGHIDGAIRHFRKALALRPGDEQARMGLNMALSIQEEQKGTIK